MPHEPFDPRFQAKIALDLTGGGKDTGCFSAFTLSRDQNPGDACAVHHATMATYNSMATLSVAAGSGSDNLGLSVGVNHQSNGASLGLDAFEHDMTFDDTLL